MLSEYGYKITDKNASDSTPWESNEYKILWKDSGTGTISRDASQGTFVYLVEDKYLSRFLDVVLGKTVKVGSALRRSAASAVFDGTQGSLPEPHPDWDNFYAASASIERMGVPDQKDSGTVWKKAKVTVVFKPLDYNVIGDGIVADEFSRFVTKEAEGQADFQTSSATQFRFVTDPNHRLLQFTPGMIVPAARFTYTWRQIPVALRTDGYPNLTVIPNYFTVQGLVGKVNSVAFDGFPPGTLLFSNWKQKLVLPQVANQGSYYWDIQYQFGARDYGTSSVEGGYNIGWNYVWDVTNARWDLVTDNGTSGGKKLYGYADLSPLFAIGW